MLTPLLTLSQAGNPHVWGPLWLKTQPPSLILLTVHVAQIPQGLDEDNTWNPSRIFKTNKCKSHNLICFLYSVQLNLEQPPPNCNKIGLIPYLSPLKTNNSEILQNWYSVSACFGSLIILSFSWFHAYSTKTWRLTLFQSPAPRKRALAFLSPCCVLCPTSHSFIPCSQGTYKQTGKAELCSAPWSTVWMPQVGQVKKEKNFISTRRNKEGSTGKTIFDLGLEEGAELQGRKLGKRIQPLGMESIGQV